ncbi:MAG: tRNA (adenosine(37)-N6)-threonylcarbamoyltransferase complex ATPase subunit type 1 TsaE [Planctomycetota bacterium]
MTPWLSTHPAQTLDLGRRLGQLARPGDVFALDGELGAGKTQLVRGLAQGMGLDPAAVSSPTFVLMHEYLDDERPDATPLLHLDAYRLSSPDDLAALGFDASLREQSVTAVEWAARLTAPPASPADTFGPDRLHLVLEHYAESARRITFHPHGRWAAALPDLLTTLRPTP